MIRPYISSALFSIIVTGQKLKETKSSIRFLYFKRIIHTTMQIHGKL
jgi:hypothetical protein